jgi:hypothetical protein
MNEKNPPLLNIVVAGVISSSISIPQFDNEAYGQMKDLNSEH